MRIPLNKKLISSIREISTNKYKIQNGECDDYGYCLVEK
jgi:hypothetical protein